MNVLIVEDEPLFASKLEMLIDRLSYSLVGVVDNGADTIQIVESQPVDLILMDINIQGKLDGIMTAEKIMAIKEIPIIFISALADEATFERAKQTRPYEFILKPFNEVQLQRTIEMVVMRLESKESKTQSWEQEVLFEESIFIKSNHKLVKVKLKDILYLEADGRHCFVYTTNKKLILRKSLTELEARLPDNFIKTHRSFLVNSERIEEVDLLEMVVVIEDNRIPISKRQKDYVLSFLGGLS